MGFEVKVEAKVELELDLGLDLDAVVKVTRATRDAHKVEVNRGPELIEPPTACRKYNVGKTRLPSLGIFLCIEGEEAIPCQLPG